MPDSTVTISGGQREVFYRLVLDHLSGVDDLLLALGREDFATAKRLGIEFGEDLRLMEDLGWDREPREDVELTMLPAKLAELLRRLRADAEGGLRESKRESGEMEEGVRVYQDALDTCDGLLSLLDLHEDELR